MGVGCDLGLEGFDPSLLEEVALDEGLTLAEQGTTELYDVGEVHVEVNCPVGTFSDTLASGIEPTACVYGHEGSARGMELSGIADEFLVDVASPLEASVVARGLLRGELLLVVGYPLIELCCVPVP